MSDRYSASVKRFRKSFGKIGGAVDIPNLMGMQKESYGRFLQRDIPVEDRKDIGLQAVFNSVFPIKDFTGTASLEFVRYRFGEPKYDVEECIQRGMTYEVPIRITVRLVVYAVDKDNGASSIRDIKEQEIYFGTIPLMTDNGTFIVNGTERVIVSQLHRSPGVFFDHDKGKAHPSGKVLYSARIIPLRGSWIDLGIDTKDTIGVRIDRRRKFPVTLLFKAFGYTDQDILDYFYEKEIIVITKGRSFSKLLNPKIHTGQVVSKEIRDTESREVIVQKGQKLTKRVIKQMEKSGIDHIPIDSSALIGRVLAHPLVDPDTGEMLADMNEAIHEKLIDNIKISKVESFSLLFIDNITTSDSIRKTLEQDKLKTQDEAVVEIYRRLRPSNPPTLETAYDFCRKLFFDPAYYDLSRVGRLKMNYRLEQDVPIEVRTLKKEDVMLTTKILVELKDAQGPVDDIDHLGDRRVRAVCELLEIQYRTGLVRMERAVKERMSLQEIEALMPHDLINSKPVSAVLREFFGTSQLSQFMDQTNPLSEITHKRRLSALGPGGLTRERAGFEVRDVHPSHYGRICPIETPEGPNIGLIVSLSTYAKVNDYGFIETPYKIVRDGCVTSEVCNLNALEEKDFPIAQANAPLIAKGRFQNPVVAARVAGELKIVNQEDVKYMDVSTNQLVSVSAALIPFLENDDANRALMGSNMQRQAVPLLTPSAPLVGTGMEYIVAKDSGVTLIADNDAEVVDVDATRIVLRYNDNGDGDKGNVKILKLKKFKRSNQNTCFNQKPIVHKGERVAKGDIIADGPATDSGELALGKNVLVGFMPWGGYNFEDSILVSERLIKEGFFTSVHIEEFELVARDTKLGKEEITRDIPNVGEEALKDLDESGIIRIGAEVKAGDILVGKITPKGETQLSPEEKLLRAIFGEKAGDVKDTSLRVPPGVAGVVIEAKVFSRKGVDKDLRSQEIENGDIKDIERDQRAGIRVIEDSTRDRLKGILAGSVCAVPVKDAKGKVFIKKGGEITAEAIDALPVESWRDVRFADEALDDKAAVIVESNEEQCDIMRISYGEKINRLQRGDELPPGVIKLVKVYVAVKRKLAVGDKMAGRHGNKGVVSRILPEEDMPYFEDGSTLDMVLNPLGVPSRMNVGRILEIHLGWAARGLGKQIYELAQKMAYNDVRVKLKNIFVSKELRLFIDKLDDDEIRNIALLHKKGVNVASPVFDGATEKDIEELMSDAGLPVSGRAQLYDGRTGDPFEYEVTVGSMYMLKLHHLVDDKIHARSIGPYSLVTQQPLGGKAQFGGQRLGEMEVWAMEAYGAAYALQEFLTVKSDDVAGRIRMYEKIVKGDHTLEPGLPESFNVLIKELQSLGLDVQLLESEHKEVGE
ncbi:MAG: DNA-directed RNA polymerase subunit beta [Pseudomonadota bacterium]